MTQEAAGAEETSFPKNRPLLTRRRVAMFAVGPASYLCFLILSRIPTLAEQAYGSVVGPTIARLLSLVTGVVPIALGELLVAALIFWQFVRAVGALLEVRRGLREAKNAIAAGCLRLAQYSGIIVGLFYLLWGFNYARPTLPARLQWPPLNDVGIEELVRLSAQTLDATNNAYLDLHGVPDLGEPSQLPEDLGAIEDALRDGWRRARQEMRLPGVSARFGRSKAPLLTGLYESLGIAGFFFPFTAEANVRTGTPALDFPKLLAHEKAHQRGVARESEANFWGYLSAALSDDPLTRYSSFRFASGQMLTALAQLDRERALELAGQRLPGVQRDIEDSRNYWRSFRGRGTAIGNTVNNAFLRSNQVEGGIQSYSMSALLFIAYSRTREGRLVPE